MFLLFFFVLLRVTKEAHSPNHQAPVVQKVDIAIRWVNLYPVSNEIGFPNTYPLDSDYPVDCGIQRLNNWGQVVTLTHAQHVCRQHSFGFPSGPFQFFAQVSNPVAFLFKPLMKPLLQMPPDPARRASLCPGVKPSCLPVLNLNETPVIYAPRSR